MQGRGIYWCKTKHLATKRLHAVPLPNDYFRIISLVFYIIEQLHWKSALKHRANRASITQSSIVTSETV